MKNKRGQGLSTNAIILIILGVMVLALVATGFAVGWKKILPFIKPGNNVDQVRENCELSCSLEKSYDYCFVKKSLVTEEEELEDATCYFLSKKRPKYGIEPCPDITCKIFNDEEEAKAACETIGEEIDYLGERGLISYECIEADISSE